MRLGSNFLLIADIRGVHICVGDDLWNLLEISFGWALRFNYENSLLCMSIFVQSTISGYSIRIDENSLRRSVDLCNAIPNPFLWASVTYSGKEC